MTVTATPTHHEIVIAGSGFSGVATALQLKRDGIEDFVVLERAEEVGGAWRDNSYPGCACDVPSIVYSLSDDPNPGWTRAFAGQQEIWDYVREITERGGVRPHLRFGRDVQRASWDEETALWTIETSEETYTASVFVSAVGALADPAIPKLPGIENFAGTTFHSAQWNHDHDLKGRRVAVVGTGASAIQFVPAIQPEVAQLQVFQRTPPWVVFRPDFNITGPWRDLFARVPQVQRAFRAAVFSFLESRQSAFRHPRMMAAVNERTARRFIKKHIKDPELRRKVTPTYRMGCKRILLSNDWYRALSKPNVDVVTDGIREVVPNGVIDDAGVLHEVDTIIYGTGFLVTDQPITHKVHGRDGRTLVESWEGSPKAYYGTTIPGFPNFFMLLGPNTGLGHNSVLLMIESQIRYLRGALDFRRRQALRTIEPRADALHGFVGEIDAAMEGSVWTAGGCQSWYLDETGRNSTLWPQTVRQFDKRISGFVPSDHHLELEPVARHQVAA